MSKLIFSLFFLLAVTCGSVFAAPPLPEQVEVFEVIPDVPSGALSQVPPPKQPTLGATAAAPYLTYLQITRVYSSNIGWEDIPSSRTTTLNDHGGAQLRVVTFELGYGSTPVAKMNGTLLPGTANYQIDKICWDAYYGYYRICNPGEIVVGFQKWWKLDGYQYGQFTYQNTSSNSPWNTMRDSLYIQ